MSGFLSFLFVLFFTVSLTLAIDNRKEKPRLSKIMWILSAAFALASSVAGYVYYLSPGPTPLIQTIGPPEKPYVTVEHSELEPPTAGKQLVTKFDVKNGPVASTVTFTNVTYRVTPFVPETHMTYFEEKDAQTVKLTPHQIVSFRWESKIVLTQDQIDDLDADEPRAELYVFARGEYSTIAGKEPLEFCRKYDRKFEKRLVFCRPNIKIE